MERTVRSRGHRISYDDEGDGTPLVLVPGFMQWAGVWKEFGYVTPLRDAGYRTISIDPLGHGASDKPHDAAEYKRTDAAADIVAVMDDLGIERAALFGYSRGAGLACTAAVECPERVSALVLGGGPTLAAGKPPAWIEPLGRGDWDEFWAAFGRIPGYEQLFEEKNDPRALGALAEAPYRFPHALDVAALRVTPLVYGGSEDNVAGLSVVARRAGTELQVLDGLDHGGAFLAPGRVVPLVLAHLAG
ncbi:MAG: hypothetical protein QOF43_109 [Gaiellaceae bacterium]|nr:hypothetical protein [Gaiellaceae bacterium]